MKEIKQDEIINVAVKAGVEILEIYNSDNFDTELKEDESPLTLADKHSNEIITTELKALYPGIPVFSEEGRSIPYDERKSWKRFWLVDPLDGTKEFIKKNGEFTVNIALIENDKPVFGVIHVPVSSVTYAGGIRHGSYKINHEDVEQISVNNNANEPLTVVKSRSHSSEEEEEFYSAYDIKSTISKGSSLKICMVAEGKAHIYFRGGPTWEWDTAAGHAILEAAGGYFVNKNKSELHYNKELPKNFGFIASSFEIQ